MPNEREIIQNNPLFAGLTDAEREALLVCLAPRRRHLKKGETLWHTGDTIKECAAVLSGRLRAESVSVSGERTVCALHAPGSLAGDILMVSENHASPVDVLAAEDTDVLLFSAHKVLNGCASCCTRHGKLRENLLAEIAEKYWAQREHLSILSRRSLRARLAAFLLYRAERAGAESFRLSISREDLADFLHANRSAVSRELSRMRAEGLIDFARDRFTLLDRAVLTHIGS